MEARWEQNDKGEHVLVITNENSADGYSTLASVAIMDDMVCAFFGDDPDDDEDDKFFVIQHPARAEDVIAKVKEWSWNHTIKRLEASIALESEAVAALKAVFEAGRGG